MIRRGLIAGSPADWARVLRVLDKGKRRVPQRELNLVLDEIALQQDAERDAATAAAERLPTRGLPRLRP